MPRSKVASAGCSMQNVSTYFLRAATLFHIENHIQGRTVSLGFLMLFISECKQFRIVRVPPFQQNYDRFHLCNNV